VAPQNRSARTREYGCANLRAIRSIHTFAKRTPARSAQKNYLGMDRSPSPHGASPLQGSRNSGTGARSMKLTILFVVVVMAELDKSSVLIGSSAGSTSPNRRCCRRLGPSRNWTPASSSATTTDKRSPMSISIATGFPRISVQFYTYVEERGGGISRM
jgi:hypothetical protein